MSTKRQHYVPRVYMKAWETEVETIKEPTKKFEGVYTFNGDNKIANGANRDSVLWKPHLYTIGFKNMVIMSGCPEIHKDFVNMIYKMMKNNSPHPFYGKLGHSIIKTKRSIRKHFDKISDWQFYYEDGNLARQNSIVNQINSLNSYVLENSFDEFYEKYWQDIYLSFVNEVRNGKAVAIGKSERTISMQAAKNMLKFFFMFLCRSPFFDAMGVYTDIKNKILNPIFQEIYKSDENEKMSDEKLFMMTKEGREYIDGMMESIWYSELYKMMFKQSGGFYHSIFEGALEGCQMILFETYDGAGNFITSDNPAFQHKSVVTAKNSNGFIFPITPKYLLFISKGADSINIVDYRMADKDTIKNFNRIIANHKMEVIVGNKKYLGKLL